MIIGLILFINCFLVGYILVNKINIIENRPVLSLNAALIVGILFCGSAFYLLDLFLVALLRLSLPSAFLYTISLTIFNMCFFRTSELAVKLSNDFKALWANKEKLLILSIFLIFCIFFTYKGFYMHNGNIIVSGGSWSDIMYHHSYVRTIAIGSNIPVTYPYFANHPMAYHFMFNYFSGLLATTELSSVFALNLLSIISLFSLLTMMVEFAEILFKKVWVGFFSAFLLIFHGSLAFFTWVKEPDAYTGLSSIVKKAGWLAYEEYEGWGLFNLRVFESQRHFPMAIAIILLVVSLIILLRRKTMAEAPKSITMKFSQQEIRSLDWRLIIFTAILIGCTPFWNMITTLCLGMFIFLFALVALLKKQKRNFLHLFFIGAIALAIILPQFLMIKSAGSSLVGYPKFFIGYFLGEFNLLKISGYYLKVLGFKLIIYLITIIFIRKEYKLDMAIFFAPFLLANIIQMGVVQYDNNKLMWVTLVFINIYVAWAIASIFKSKKLLGKVLPPIIFRTIAIAFTFLITISGVVDYFGVINNMEITAEISYKNSPSRQWIEQSTPLESIFLTYNRIPFEDNIMTQINLAGRLLYSVGNCVDGSCDIAPRADFTHKIYVDDSLLPDEKIRMLQQEKINYVVIDFNVREHLPEVREDFFFNNLRLVYNEHDVLIFEVPN